MILHDYILIILQNWNIGMPEPSNNISLLFCRATILYSSWIVALHERTATWIDRSMKGELQAYIAAVNRHRAGCIADYSAVHSCRGGGMSAKVLGSLGLSGFRLLPHRGIIPNIAPSIAPAAPDGAAGFLFRFKISGPHWRAASWVFVKRKHFGLTC